MRTSFENVSILSLASVDAPHRVTSEAIMTQLAPTLERLGVRRDLLENLSGIRARRWWDPGVDPAQLAQLSAQLQGARDLPAAQRTQLAELTRRGLDISPRTFELGVGARVDF